MSIHAKKGNKVSPHKPPVFAVHIPPAKPLTPTNQYRPFYHDGKKQKRVATPSTRRPSPKTATASGRRQRINTARYQESAHRGLDSQTLVLFARGVVLVVELLLFLPEVRTKQRQGGESEPNKKQSASCVGTSQYGAMIGAKIQPQEGAPPQPPAKTSRTYNNDRPSSAVLSKILPRTPHKTNTPVCHIRENAAVITFWDEKTWGKLSDLIQYSMI